MGTHPKDSAHPCVYTRHSGGLRSSPPSYSDTTTWYPHDLDTSRYLFIGCFVPKHPDTLNPNGNSIIHQLLASRPKLLHVEPGPFRGPFTINLISLCSSEGSRPLRGLPLRLPFYTLGFKAQVNYIASSSERADRKAV